MSDEAELAFETVVSEYNGLILRIASSYEANPAMREDLVQEILLAVWRALPSFKGEAKLKTFITSIAQKRAISHSAKYARQKFHGEPSVDIVDEAKLPDEMAAEVDERQRLLDAVRSLGAAQREPVMLMLEGMNFSEIGEVLGISANAATLRCQRAKAALYEELNAAR